MPVFLISLGLFVCGTSLLGQTIGVIPQAIPDRPVQAFATVKGQPLPLVGYDKDKPVVLVEGARKTVARDAVSLRGIWEQTPGVVKVSLKQSFPNDEDKLGLQIGSAKMLEAELTADRDMPEAFALVVVYHTLGNLLLMDTEMAILGQELGNLQTDKPYPLKLKFPVLRVDPDSVFFRAKPPTPRWGLLRTPPTSSISA